MAVANAIPLRVAVLVSEALDACVCEDGMLDISGGLLVVQSFDLWKKGWALTSVMDIRCTGSGCSMPRSRCMKLYDSGVFF